MGVPSFCKTSSLTGLHIYIPVRNKFIDEQSKEFDTDIFRLANHDLPETKIIKRPIKERKGKGIALEKIDLKFWI
jgi:bifunctional non-homologous end joining protein LigD